MKVTDKFVLFWRDYIGNWSRPQKQIEYWDKHWEGPVPPGMNSFLYSQRKFPTSEHLFMYIKAVHFKDWETAEKIVNAKSPKEAKDLGREVKNFDEKEWEHVREDAMFTALVSRSYYDDMFKDVLLNPYFENLEFVEASPFDRIWGIGLGEEEYNANIRTRWLGKNLLGKCLCECRRYLKFQEYLKTFEEFAFFEDMIWCPSQIEYFFTDPNDGQMYVVYCRWRWSDPWTIELVKVANPSNPHKWNFDLMDEHLNIGEFKDQEYRLMEKEVVEYLRTRFPQVQFPSEIKTKNCDDWNGLKLI